MLNCVGSLLFLQTQQCSALAKYAASAIGGMSCGFPSLLARLAFLLTRDDRTKRSCNKQVGLSSTLAKILTLAQTRPKPQPQPLALNPILSPTLP